MLTNDKNVNELKKDYLNKLTSQVFGKEYRAAVSREISSHIDDTFEATVGDSESERMILALEKTGDPIKLGRKLNHVYNPKPKIIWLLILLFLFITFDKSDIRMFIDPPSFWSVAFGTLIAFLTVKLYSKRKKEVSKLSMKAYSGCVVFGGLFSVIHSIIIIIFDCMKNENNIEILRQYYRLIYQLATLGLFYALVIYLIMSLLTSYHGVFARKL